LKVCVILEESFTAVEALLEQPLMETGLLMKGNLYKVTMICRIFLLA
jgi:hypothetical protein